MLFESRQVQEYILEALDVNDYIVIFRNHCTGISRNKIQEQGKWKKNGCAMEWLIQFLST